MGPFYYEQLRRHLEPESISIQSKTKSITAKSQHSSLLRGAIGIKNKQHLFRNQRIHDSFSSFDTTVLL
ncbi:unnamed protein product [Rotaria sp. Silwood2]|nr:unnamed protein product [Rotaria sp. Silwood2]CAF3110352.1 unnamed protein product [Rotaria sp. Silwood2]CAF3948521.1 unnamed protein product [Rotaria sp. Silwood2]